jgi:hypothetical protein
MRRGSLYKYKSLSALSFDHVTEIIRDCMIYVPRPSQLNDPEECRPLQTICDISDPSYRPKIEAWVRRCVAHRVPLPSEAEIQIELQQLNQKHLEELIKEAIPTFHQEVEKRYRILSLADSKENHHLWSAYADYYTGICLEFFVDPFFGSAYQVQYADATPAFDITDNESFDTLVATALTKRLKWSEESEYRLIFADPPINGDLPLLNQKFQFPRKVLTSIIFGYKVNEKHRNYLLELVKAVSPHMGVFEASGGPPFQKITITPLRI